MYLCVFKLHSETGAQLALPVEQHRTKKLLSTQDTLRPSDVYIQAIDIHLQAHTIYRTGTNIKKKSDDTFT